MSIADTFNKILKQRTEWEAALGTPTLKQWADWVLLLSSGNPWDEAASDLVEAANETGAGSLLTYSFKMLHEELRKESTAVNARRDPRVDEMLRLISDLLDDRIPVQSDAEVRERLTQYRDRANAMLSQHDPSGEENDVIVASVEVPTTADEDFPYVSLLWSQVVPLVPIIKATGRQKVDQEWEAWFKEQLNGLDIGKKTGAFVLKRFINDLLDPLLGSNINGFGSELLVPVKAMANFPAWMTKQSLLYDLEKYGHVKLGLPADNAVLQAIRDVIKGIDWSAVKMVGKMFPPATLLIAIHGGAKWLKNKAWPEGHEFYKEAQTLIYWADQIRTEDSAASRLALMTIMHLAETPMAYVKIMTEPHKDAFKELSKKMAV